MGDIRVKSVGGNFVASNANPIVDLLPATGEQRANKLHGVNFTAMDAQNNNDRIVMALNMGKHAVGQTIETGGHRTVNITDPFTEAEFLHIFVHAAVAGGHSGGGQVGNSHYVPLHGLEMVEQIDLILTFPDNTTDMQWFCDLYFESIRITRKEWAAIRHRPPVEHVTIGTVTV